MTTNSVTQPNAAGTRLRQLFEEQGQSPWLDNLPRPYLRDGTLARYVANGIRGVTANPTIFTKAIEASDAYDEQFHRLIADGCSVKDAYWQLVITDVREALALLRPTFDASDRTDGFVSIEVAPELAHDTAGTVSAGRKLHAQINEPNLFVKVPATSEGIDAVRTLTAEGHSINVTLIFSLSRYEQVIEAYLSGLEQCLTNGGDISAVRSVASFFVSRVDAEVDKRLEAIGTEAAVGLCGKAAISQAQLAYQMFRRQFSGRRWAELARQGARLQRPLWASTSTKNPAYPDTLYVETLIGPDTVNTLPESTIEAFEKRGKVRRSIDVDVSAARAVLEQIEGVGVSMADVGGQLEEAGVRSFHESFQHVLESLDHKRSREAR